MIKIGFSQSQSINDLFDSFISAKRMYGLSERTLSSY